MPNFRAAAVLILALLGTPMMSAASDAPTYAMVSGWGLYPALNNATDPATASLLAALSEIGRDRVSGIAYGTLGVAPRIRAKANLGDDFDPNAYNRRLFQLARQANANLWLQLRYYDNWIAGANLTAPQILSDPSAANAFLQSAMAAVRTYENAYRDNCTVILGEEETIYHSKDGGGLFWAGQEAWDRSAKRAGGQYLRPNAALDEAFVESFTAINRLLIGKIRSEYPGCRVGIHIGHEPVYQTMGDTTGYGLILRKLAPLKVDFTFYDLYEKISRTDSDFREKLSERIPLLKSLGPPVYYLAQLQTTNSFGAGGGRTPSAAEIDETADMAKRLKVDGFGYYTKNAVPTLCDKSTASTAGCNALEDLNPLDPNTIGQSMVWQSSPGRWSYGLSKLASFRVRAQ